MTIRPDHSSSRALRVLWVTTKSPWPAHDGGRLLMDGTLRSLDPEHVRVSLVFPAQSSAARGSERAPSESGELARSGLPPCLDEVVEVPVPLPPRAPLSLTRPATAERHRFSTMRGEVGRRLECARHDVIHVEQPHALENVPDTKTPILLRAQNVEQDLWYQMARAGKRPLRWALAAEARRVARWERAMLRRAQRVVAISTEDQERLGEIAGRDHPSIQVIRPALASSQTAGPALDGDPALSLFAGSSWGPNRDGARHFLQHAWPKIRAARSGSRLHVFGGESSHADQPGVEHHASPFVTERAFGEGALVVVPVRAASGVRMKILDAWSRGLAVVMTQTGAIGLGSRGRDILEPVDGLEYLHQAVLRLADPSAAAKQVQLGRQWMEAHTKPTRVGSAFLEVYRQLATRFG